MLIGVCDDNDIIRKEIIEFCHRFRESSLIQYEIVGFSSGEKLLAYEKLIDILFLDIQMRGINGVKTAEKIREKDDSMIIIFLTGFRAFMQEGYRVKAFRYLLKPIKEEELAIALREAIEDMTKNTKAVVDKQGETVFVKLKNIFYIESEGRGTLVRTNLQSFDSVLTMNEWEEILNTDDFYRVHKAYIVNMEFVEEIGKYILLDNGEKVELSVRKAAKFKKACKEYRRRNAR
ncbi:MAG TPA: DNA-binding response regulator [Lachnospiraceae bacterium]|nr:DNA-binding response regulator [Lachnospiraceae bacterium]